MKRNTRELIINGAIRNIQEIGLQNVSIRTIAKECDITFSNIGYYFKTKEELLDEVTKRIWEINVEEMSSLWENRASEQEGLQSIARYLIVGGIDNRKVVLSAFVPIIQEEKDSYFFTMFNTLFTRIISTSNISKTNLYHFFSSIFFTTLCPNVFIEQDIDFRDNVYLENYIQSILEVIE